MRVFSSGARAYREQAEFASRSSEGSSARSPSAQAKTTTKTFGLNLGKFRIKYTEQDTSFDAEQVVRAAYDLRRKKVERAFTESMDVETERTRSFDTNDSAPAPAGSLHRRKAAVLAYEKNSVQAGSSRPGVLIGVV